MKLEFSRQIFEESSNIKFHQNPSSGSRVVPCGRMAMTKLIVAFRNFANAPNSGGGNNDNNNYYYYYNKDNNNSEST
jgi:hypothetical protein